MLIRLPNKATKICDTKFRTPIRRNILLVPILPRKLESCLFGVKDHLIRLITLTMFLAQ